MKNKSLHQLRGIAQSYAIPDIFAKDAKQLIQAIELKQQDMIPEPAIEIKQPEYDPRLMTKVPARKSDQQAVKELLAPFVKLGMHLTFDQEHWYMRHDKKTDEGTLRMPLRVILRCAERIMK